MFTAKTAIPSTASAKSAAQTAQDAANWVMPCAVVQGGSGIVALRAFCAVVAFAAFTGCATPQLHGAISIGKNGRYTEGGFEEVGTGVMLRAGVRWNRWGCNYTHMSDPSRGNGVNDKPDYFTGEHIGCGLEF